MSAIEASGLCQGYGTNPVLHEVHLQVEPGERVAVLGENGAGKTTLLRLLATAARPTAGTLRLLGQDATRARSQLRRRIGYLAHEPGLYPQLTTLENLEFFCSLLAVGRGRAREMIELVGLQPAARVPAAELSRGMRQRLALGRSLLHEPELWILDEPDASLDEPGRELLAKLARGRTLVMATHDRVLGGSLCTRLLDLRGGRLETPLSRLEVVG
jgi:heme ABC exporter ATP-binding subunit CcmA